MDDIDLESMSFSAHLNELDEGPFGDIVACIDLDLRNGISHGDMVIDGIDNNVAIADDKFYSYDEFEQTVNLGVAVSDFVSFIDIIVIYEWLERTEGNYGKTYQVLIDGPGFAE